ncbi:MAG TPA: hypothetical protein VGH73_02570 [Thermoanaerobaculia bacterium]|jgi:hypothetical protein
MLKRLALGLLTAWAAAGFLYEVNAAVAGYDGRADAIGGVPWRLGAPEPVAVERCVGAARETIPPGSAVAFTSPGDDPDHPDAAFKRWRWAAYLLPEDDVLQASDPSAARLAGYAIACGTAIHDPRVEPIQRLPDGWLYRVTRP